MAVTAAVLTAVAASAAGASATTSIGLAAVGIGGALILSNQTRQAERAQQSAAETAAGIQQQAFEAQQQAFDQLLTQTPDPEAIKDEAKEAAKRRRLLATQTILTSPFGIVNEPATFRKTLLGG